MEQHHQSLSKVRNESYSMCILKNTQIIRYLKDLSLSLPYKFSNLRRGRQTAGGGGGGDISIQYLWTTINLSQRAIRTAATSSTLFKPLPTGVKPADIRKTLSVPKIRAIFSLSIFRQRYQHTLHTHAHTNTRTNACATPRSLSMKKNSGR